MTTTEAFFRGVFALRRNRGLLPASRRPAFVAAQG